MTTPIPVVGYPGNSARLQSDLQTYQNTMLAIIMEMLGATGEAATATIMSNTFTPGNDNCLCPIDTNSLPSDTLDTIQATNLRDGQVLYLRIVNSSHVITIANNAGGAGQIYTADGGNIVLTSTSQWVALVYRASITAFVELFRSSPNWGSPGAIGATTANTGAFSSLTLSTPLGAASGGTGINAGSAANGSLLIGNGSGFTLSTLTQGPGITITDAAGKITIAASGGGTVTSVGLTDNTGVFNVTGSPVTTSGTLALSSFKSQAADTAFGNFTGSSAAPTFGVVSIGAGGTGQTSAASAFNALAPSTATGGLIVGTGTNSYGNLAAGTNTQQLTLSSGAAAWTYGLSGGVSPQNSTATLTNSVASFITTNPGATAASLTLPAANSCPGKVLTFEYIGGTATTTLKTNSTNSDTFDGASSSTTIALTTAGQTITMISDGGNPGNWRIIHPLTITSTGLTLNHSAGEDTIGLSTSVVTSAGSLSPLFTTSISSNALSFSLSNAAANTIFCNTAATSAAPAYKSLSITAGTGLTGGGNITNSPTISLSTPVSVANGGTGLGTYTSGSLVYASATATLSGLSPVNGGVLTCASSVPAYVAAGTAGQILTSNGSAAAAWTTNTYPTTDAKGDLHYASAANTISGLAIGGANTVLNSSGTLPQWGNITASMFGSNVLTTSQLPLTSVNSVGNLSPLFTASIASQALSFNLTNAAPTSWFGNATGSSAAPAFNTSLIPNSLINWAAPSAIGSTTPAAGTFTTISLSGYGISLQASGNNGFGSGITGDTIPRITETSDGNLDFGPGSAGALDTRLQRSAAGVLQVVTPSGAMADLGSAMMVNGCRLYSSSADPFGDSSGSAGNLYWGPAFSNICTFWNGTVGVPQVVAECSLALSGLSTGTVYDVYVKSTSTTTAAIQSLTAWTGLTTPPTRGTDGLGRPTKSGDTTALWVGIVTPVSATSISDQVLISSVAQPASRGISNAYNTISKQFCYTDTAVASYTYASATWRATRGQTYSAGLSFLSFVTARHQNIAAQASQYIVPASTVNAYIGINLDSGTGDPSSNNGAGNVGVANGPSTTGCPTSSFIFQNVSPGLHTLIQMERLSAAATSTFNLLVSSEQCQCLTAWGEF